MSAARKQSLSMKIATTVRRSAELALHLHRAAQSKSAFGVLQFCSPALFNPHFESPFNYPAIFLTLVLTPSGAFSPRHHVTPPPLYSSQGGNTSAEQRSGVISSDGVRVRVGVETPAHWSAHAGPKRPLQINSSLDFTP